MWRNTSPAMSAESQSIITSSSRDLMRRRAHFASQRGRSVPPAGTAKAEESPNRRTSMYKDSSTLTLGAKLERTQVDNEDGAALSMVRLVVVCMTLFTGWLLINVGVWVIVTQGLGVEGYKNADLLTAVAPALPDAASMIASITLWHHGLLTEGKALLPAPALPNPGATQSCIAVLKEELFSRFPATSPTTVQSILSQLGLDGIPTIRNRLAPYLQQPQPSQDILEGLFGCIESSSTLPPFACSILSPTRLESVYDGLMKDAMHTAVILDSVVELLREDIATLHDVADLMMANSTLMNDPLRGRKSLLRLPNQEPETLQATYATSAKRLTNLAAALAKNEPLSLQSNLQTEILTAVERDIAATNEENARVGMALASEVHFEPTVGPGHHFSWPLGTYWAQSYMTWKIAAQMALAQQDSIQIFFTNLATCSAIESTQADAYPLSQILLETLMPLVPRTLPTSSLAEIQGQVEMLGNINFQEAQLSRPPPTTVSAMLQKLCIKSECVFAKPTNKYASTDTVPTSNLNEPQFAVYMGFFLWFTVLLAGLGLELITWSTLVQGGWSEDRQALWKLAQFIFPLLMATSVGLSTHQNYMAMPFAVAGLWKLGFPETLVYMHTAIYGTYLQALDIRSGRAQRAVEFFNAVGTVVHHGAASLLICMFLSGAAAPTSHILGPAIIPVMQHWFVLFRYVNTTVYSIVEITLEVYFEWSLFSEFEHCKAMHWIVLQIAFTMLAAHWLYLLAAFIEMFIPKHKKDPARSPRPGMGPQSSSLRSSLGRQSDGLFSTMTSRRRLDSTESVKSTDAYGTPDSYLPKSVTPSLLPSMKLGDIREGTREFSESLHLQESFRTPSSEPFGSTSSQQSSRKPTVRISPPMMEIREQETQSFSLSESVDEEEGVEVPVLEVPTDDAFQDTFSKAKPDEIDVSNITNSDDEWADTKSSPWPFKWGSY